MYLVTPIPRVGIGIMCWVSWYDCFVWMLVHRIVFWFLDAMLGHACLQAMSARQSVAWFVLWFLDAMLGHACLPT